MSYTNNPNMPKVRMNAVKLVYQGWSIRKASRYVGVHPSTIMRWIRKDHDYGTRPIPTFSSRPNSHPNQLDKGIVDKIVELRKQHHRCAEVIHKEMINLEYSVSLSSVKRTLKRKCLIKQRSPWKRYHIYPPRPKAVKPGDLVQIDTIHLIPGELYIYTLMDVFSRWTQARVSERINTHRSLLFVCNSEKQFPFNFNVLQSDHGTEFSSWFTEHIQKKDIHHRHSRIRKPTDNGHLERFNRTLQEECLKGNTMSYNRYRRIIPEYINYYNNERLHLGLELKTPNQMLRSY